MKGGFEMNASFTARALLMGILAALPSSLSAMGTSSAPSSTPSANAPDFDPSAEYRKGIDALQASKFADAKSSFSRVLGVAPNDANTNFLAGMADAGLNDFKGAAKHYEKAVHADGKMVVAQQELAITYLKLGDRPKADATLGKLKGLDADCKGTCKDEDLIKKAIATVQTAIGRAGPGNAERPRRRSCLPARRAATGLSSRRSG